MQFNQNDNYYANRSLMTKQPDPMLVNAENNYASEFHKRLVKWIDDFDASLDEKHEVGLRLVSFGQTVTFHLQNLRYWNPSLISFSGTTETGAPVELIQHVSQISLLLMKMPRLEPEKPKRPLGFHLTQGGDTDTDINRESK
jgi:Family of unknown function (DUF6173)